MIIWCWWEGERGGWRWVAGLGLWMTSHLVLWSDGVPSCWEDLRTTRRCRWARRGSCRDWSWTPPLWRWLCSSPTAVWESPRSPHLLGFLGCLSPVSGCFGGRSTSSVLGMRGGGGCGPSLCRLMRSRNCKDFAGRTSFVGSLRRLPAGSAKLFGRIVSSVCGPILGVGWWGWLYKARSIVVPIGVLGGWSFFKVPEGFRPSRWKETLSSLNSWARFEVRSAGVADHSFAGWTVAAVVAGQRADVGHDLVPVADGKPWKCGQSCRSSDRLDGHLVCVGCDNRLSLGWMDGSGCFCPFPVERFGPRHPVSAVDPRAPVDCNEKLVPLFPKWPRWQVVSMTSADLSPDRFSPSSGRALPLSILRGAPLLPNFRVVGTARTFLAKALGLE